ncbi:MAG TPA: fibronectin type III domain-containing protein [Verrucomicrobiae bacterium]|nr:fibronectin type III domain-containing protein [Verrucomicrobiae bacterium]
MKRYANCIAVAICFFAATAFSSTNMTPVTVTGFIRDVVVPNTASGPPYTNYAMEFNQGEGTAFYQSGLPGYSYGLPVSGSFTNPVDGTVFQFQPYTASNILVLYNGGISTGTLTLPTPAKYSRIAIAANSGNGTTAGTATVLLTFDDGSTFTTNYYAPDWFNNVNTATYTVALQGVDRINLTSGAADGGSSGNPRFYQTTIPLFMLGSSNKPLSKLTFGMPASTLSTGIYAVSGLPSSAVSPPMVTNSPATDITALTATLNGQVTSTGDETPAVTLFYGPTNGGTVAANWANSVAIGYQGGVFSQTVSSLSPGTTYYFSAQAVNSGGTVWASPSRSFTTPQLAVAVVSNLPASNVQGTIATVNGDVVSSGGQTPAVTIYYGSTDGGTNPAAWSNSIALGDQGGAFAQTISGLATNSSYYFTAEAVNAAGTAWATPSLMFATVATNSPWPFVAVLTQHNDDNRSGDNFKEVLLNTSNVNTNQFGLLYTRPVDDQIYAQPLVMTNVNILGRGSRNLLIVATVNDSIYAFDADDPSVTLPYWQDSFISPPNIIAPDNADESAIGACGGDYMDFSGNFGIVGTPVIDPASGTMYVVVRTKEISGGTTTFVQRLHALDVATGAERPNSPVVITATYPGTGDGGTEVDFDPLRENPRPGLALANGIVYITWASHCDNTPYHGWVIGYNETNLEQAIVWNDSPNGSEAGIWASGQAPAVDTNGNVYITVGNGTTADAANDYGESFLKLTPTNGTMNVDSYFIPYNWSYLNQNDLDLGCAGMLLIPGTTLGISGGKAGVLYLVNRDDMGGVSDGNADTNVVETWSLDSSEIHGAPVWWTGANGSFIYIWPDSGDQLRQYQFTNGLFDTTPYAEAATVGGSGSPGGILSVSANSTNAGTAIVWATVNTTSDANQAVVAGTLHAYDARDVTNELWNSDMVPARDALGNLAKFVPPTVANGKVYVATFSGHVDVYGLLPPPALTINLSGSATLISWPTNAFLDYTLQTSTNLISGNWVNVPNARVATNGTFQVTVPASVPAAFYRLYLP